MNTHTHRGHCQVCLRVHAIDTETGRLATHGYRVLGHSFVGDCAGSHELSLHITREITDRIIASELRNEKAHTAHADALRAGTITPETVWTGKYVTIRTQRPGKADKIDSEREMIPWADAVGRRHTVGGMDLCAEQVKMDIHVAKRRAEFARDHAARMTYWADRITGKVDAYRVEDLEAREWAVGDTVRIGGKKGFDAVIEAIEDRPYRTSGFRQGSRSIMCPHARITSPAVTEKRVSEAAGGYITRDARPAKTFWEALRNIKRPPNALAAELKKADIL